MQCITSSSFSVFVFNSFLWSIFKDTRRSASLILRLLVTLDKMAGTSINHQLKQEQEKMMLANNIITALVHISLVQQKPSVRNVSRMMLCSKTGRIGVQTKTSDTIVMSVNEALTHFRYIKKLKNKNCSI